MTGKILVALGVWLVQDSLASIAFYPKEKWFFNHLARLIRAVMGATLIVIGFKKEGKK